MPSFKTAFGKHVSDDLYFPEDELSLTKQSFAAECDINNIIKRYQKTGVIEHEKQYQGRYEDFSNVRSYQDSLNSLFEAQESFMSLPSSVRKRFDNDPGLFLDFVHDEKNLDEMISMGLAKKIPEKVPSEVSVDEKES